MWEWRLAAVGPIGMHRRELHAVVEIRVEEGQWQWQYGTARRAQTTGRAQALRSASGQAYDERRRVPRGEKLPRFRALRAAVGLCGCPFAVVWRPRQECL